MSARPWLAGLLGRDTRFTSGNRKSRQRLKRLRGQMEQLEARQMLALAAANVTVTQLNLNTDAASFTLSASQNTSDFGFRPGQAGSSKGDFTIQIGSEHTDDAAAGTLITTIRNNGRVNAGETTLTGTRYGLSSINVNDNGWRVSTNDAVTTGDGAQMEYNFDFAAVYFPHADGWQTGTIANGTASPAAVTISGVNSATDGILLVNSETGDSNFSMSAPTPGNGGWNVWRHAGGVNSGTFTTTPARWVYVPYSTPTSTAIVGRVMAATTAGADTPTIQSGQANHGVSIARNGVGEYRLTIAGQSPTTGVLLLSHENNGNNYNDNFVSYQASGNEWIIQVRDITPSAPPGGSPSLQDPDFTSVGLFSFVFVPVAPPVQSPNAILDVDAGGKLIYTAGDGKANNVTVSDDGANLIIADTGDTITLTQAAIDFGFTGSGTSSVSMSLLNPNLGNLSSVDARLFSGNDTVNLNTALITLPITIDGGGDAGDNLILNENIDGSGGPVSFTGFGGSITQAAGKLLSGSTITLGAGTIGSSGSPLRTAGTTVNVSGGAGGVFITDSDAVNFAATATGAGNIQLANLTGNLTTTGNIITATGNISLSSPGAIAVNAAVNAGSGTITIAANTDGVGADGFTQASTGTLSTTNNTASAISITVNTAAGGTGNATVGVASSGGDYNVTTHVGSILWQTALGAYTIPTGTASGTNYGSRITAVNYNLTNSGAGGIGAANAPLQFGVANTRNATLNAGSGGIFVADNAGGILNIARAVATGGDILLITNDGGSHDLQISGPVTTGNGNIRLMADDNITLATTALIGGAAFGGTIRIQPNMDQNTGQSFIMNGDSAIITTNNTANAVSIEQTSNAGNNAVAQLQNITVGDGGTITVNTTPVAARSGGITLGAGKSLNAGPTGTVRLIARDLGIGTAANPIVVTAGNVIASNTAGATAANPGSIFVQSTIASSMQATTTTAGAIVGEIQLSTTAGNLTINGPTNTDSGAITLTSAAGVIINDVLGDANQTGAVTITAAAGAPVTFNAATNLPGALLHVVSGHLTEAIVGALPVGNLTLDGTATLDVAIAGTGPDQHPEIHITGAVNLNGVALNVSVNGYTSTGAGSFVIIRNDGSDQITGTFAGLPQGTAIVVGTSTFYIHYFGGDGNDVALVETAPAANLPPSAFPDTYTLDLSTGTTLSVAAAGPLTNDFDPEGDTPITLQLVTTTEDGDLTVSNDGSFTFTPPATTTGTYTFTYRATDGTSFSLPQTVTINVINRPVPPIAVDDVANTPASAAVVVNVLNNDSDPNGDTFSVTAVSTPTNGTAIFDATTVTYTPNGGFAGYDHLTYTITDSSGKTASATITVRVSGTGTSTVSFQQGVNGYAGTVDTSIIDNAADADRSATTPLVIDLSPVSHTLIRFEDIFGSGPNQIPAGSIITSATFTVFVTNVGTALNFHRMLMPWASTATYNSTGAAPFNNTTGIQADGVEALAPADHISAAVSTNNAFFDFNVTNSLQAWLANPSSNYGWAIIPPGTDDSVQFPSSEGATVDQRPKLTVSFIPPPNLPPVQTLKNEVLLDEDGSFAFTGASAISVADPDAGTADVQTTVSLPANSGTLAITQAAGATVTGAGTNNVQITGPITAVNDTLASLIYTPPANFNGEVVMTVSTNDQGHTGPGTAQSDTDTVLLTVRSINDEPTFNTLANPPSITSVSGPQTVVGFATGGSAGPADEAAQVLTYTVTQTGSTNGLTFTVAPTIVGANGTLTYTTTPGASGTATFSVVLHDDGSRLAPHDNESAPQSFTITVIGENQVPVNTAPLVASVDEDGSLAFTGPLLLSIADADAGTAAVRTTLSIPAGTGALNVTAAGGATITGGGTTSVQINGPITAINATLASLTFVPTPNSNGPVTLTMLTSDLGNTGDGGAKTDTDTIAITVNAINDAPSFGLGPDPSTTQSSGPQTVTGFATNVLAGPPDEAGQSLQFVITPTGTTGGLTFSTAPTIDAAGNLTYTATAGAFGTATFSVLLRDGGSNVAPHVNESAAQTFTITVIAQNQPPINTAPIAVSVNEDGSLAFTGPNLVSIVDPDAGAASVRTTISVQTPGAGTLAATAAGGAVISGSSTNLVINGTVAAINATLASLVFTPAADYFGSASLQVVTDDLGNTGPGGAKTDTDVINITVTPVNDLPSFTLSPDPIPDVTLNAGLRTIPSFARNISAGPANEASQTLTFNLTVTASNGLTFSTLAINPQTGALTYAANTDSFGEATISVVLSDGLGNSTARTFTIRVLEEAYTPIVTGPESTVRGMPTTFTFETITNPDDIGNRTLYEVDWDGNGTIDETFTETDAAFEVSHVFMTEGQKTFYVTATDLDAGHSASIEYVIDVGIVGLVENQDGGYDAVVGGTIFADRISLTLMYSGSIQVKIGSKAYVLPDADGKIIIYGLDGGDTISVAANVPYNTAIYGGAGNDYIAGGVYDDYLDGGDGADRLLGGAGNNSYDGGAGNDVLTGRGGNEYMFGGAGNDNIFGAAGDDIIDGGAGNDKLNGSTGNDIIRGGAGTDVIRGEAGHDILLGGDGNDTLYGLGGRDILIGGGQADQLRGGIDDDILIGGKTTWDYGPETADEFFDDELRAALYIWLMPQSISQRVATLTDEYFNESTIENDLNARDTLYGEQDNDWFLIHTPDVISSKTALDIRTDLS